MAHDGEIRVRITADNKDLGRKIKDSEKKLQGFGKTAKKAGQLLAGAFAGTVILNGIKNAIKSIAQLESSIRRVSLIAGGGEEKFAKLAKTLGGSTVFTANQAAEAMGFLAQAGFSTNQILTATPGILDLAAAAQLDLGRAADIASNILSGFGLSASEVNRVNDILVTTTNSANLSVEQMGEAMKVVAPIAKSAGISINTVAGFMGVLGDAGIQGSLAGTQLKGVLSSLIKPSTEAAKVFEKLGVEIINNEDGSLNLSATLTALKNAGLSTADAFTIFGERAAAGALVMANATEKADALAEATKEIGIASLQAKRQLDTLSGDMALFSSAIDGTVQKGSSLIGFFRDVTQGATNFVLIMSGQNAPALQLKRLQSQLKELEGGEGVFDALRKSTIGYSLEVSQLKAQIDEIVNAEANQAAALALNKDFYDSLTGSIEDQQNALFPLVPTLEELTKKRIESIAALADESKELEKSLVLMAERQRLTIALSGSSLSLTELTRDGTEALMMQNLANEGSFEVQNKLSEVEKGRLQALTEGIIIKGIDVKVTDQETKAQQNVAKASGEAAVQAAVLAAANRDGAKSIVQASLAAALAAAIKSAFVGSPNPILGLALAAAGVAGINALFSAIPSFAAGTPNFGGGMALVGERGPEVVNLPGGSSITPHLLSRGSMGGSVSIVVNGFVGNEQELARTITEVLDNQSDNTSRLL